MAEITDADVRAAKAWIERLEAASDISAQFESLLPDPLTRGIAAALHDAAHAKIASGELPEGAHLCALAFLAYDRLDLPAAALDVQLDRLQAELARAEDLEPHRALRDEFESAAFGARRLGRDDLLMRAESGAGDCALFAAHATADHDDRRALLRLALAHATTALYACPEEPDIGPLGQTVSQLLQTVEDLKGPRTDSPEHDELQAARRRAAAALEGVLATGPEIAWRADRAWIGHGRIARLLYEHGSTEAAAVHAERALKTAPADQWIPTAASFYAAAKESIDPDAKLEALRRRPRERAEEHRARRRSVAGRLHAGLELDTWLGDALRDDMMGVAWSDDPVTEEQLAAVALEGERGKARLLLDRLAGVSYVELPTPELRDRAAAVEAQVMRLGTAPIEGMRGEELRLASLLAPPTMYEAERMREQRLVEVEQLLDAHGAGFSAAACVSPIPQIVAALEPGEVLLDFFNPYDVYEPSSQAFCATLSDNGLVWPRVPPLLSTEDQEFVGRIFSGDSAPVDASPLGWQIVLLRMAIREGDDDAALSILGTLWQLLVDPVIEAGYDPAAADRWVIAPHGVLHLIPWPALRSRDGRFLGDLVPLSVAPSATAWHRMATCSRPAARSALILGNPALGAGNEPLEEAEAEATEVAERLGQLQVEVEVRTGAGASEEVLRDRAPGAGVVHLATHGDFPEETAMDLHRLLLAPTGGADGAVHAHELAMVDLSAARLVMLSVCNGGTVRFGPADEPYGLVPALLAAGAENVLATLWPIEDAAGRAFASAFYNRLADGDPARALVDAMHARRESGAPVRDWAAYALTGVGRPFRLG